MTINTTLPAPAATPDPIPEGQEQRTYDPAWLAEMVDLAQRHHITAYRVDVDAWGIKFQGKLTDRMPDLIPAFALRLTMPAIKGHAFDRYTGKTLLGTPIAIVNDRGGE